MSTATIILQGLFWLAMMATIAGLLSWLGRRRACQRDMRRRLLE